MNQNIKSNQALAKLIQDIYSVGDDTISCDQASILIIRCVDNLFSADEARQEYPQLFQHFAFCRSCEREYNDLLALSQIESLGKLPKPRRIPPMPPLGLSLVERAKNALVKIFTDFSPELAAAVRSRRGAQHFAPTIIDFAPAPLTLSLTLTNDATRAELRTLRGDIEVTADHLQERLEGTVITLENPEGSAIIQESTLSDLGAFEFFEVPPATYSLWFSLNRQEYAVTKLELP